MKLMRNGSKEHIAVKYSGYYLQYMEEVVVVQEL